MTMTINQQFIDLTTSAWMDADTQQYFGRFNPADMEMDEFMNELDDRDEDLLHTVGHALGRDFTAEAIADGVHSMSDYVIWLYENPELPFIMMAWDMAADGWLSTGPDSIGRMEDYETC